MRAAGLVGALVFGCGGGKSGDTSAPVEEIPAWGDCEAHEPGLDIGGSIAMTMPPTEGRNISPNTPIVLFMASGVDAAEIDRATIEVRTETEAVAGTVHVLASGRALAFIAEQSYPANMGISVSVGTDGYFEFHTGAYASEAASHTNLGFEQGATVHGEECERELFTDNYVLFGDSVISDVRAGSVDATEGTHRLLMSTGEVLGGAALERTTSFLVSQPFETGGFNTMSFDVRLASEEFSGDGNDDALLLVIQGPTGVLFEEVTSVASVSDAARMAYPGLLDASGSAWDRHSVLGLSAVGSPIVLTLILADAVDAEGTTGIALDFIRMD